VSRIIIIGGSGGFNSTSRLEVPSHQPSFQIVQKIETQELVPPVDRVEFTREFSREFTRNFEFAHE
jgi:hypothetical protein